MSNITQNKPISLYIHFPWCIKKCPYCDFNSHALRGNFPEKDYINRLLTELQSHQQLLSQRLIHSIFMGGGTPSLFSAQSIDTLLSCLRQQGFINANTEITLEANPGTLEQKRFEGYVQAGVNRLSLGIQSFQPNHLKALGRIHDDIQAKQAIIAAKRAGFNNINLDLMYGLEQQSVQQALADLQEALQYQVQHLSWYQLTIEPNTYFNRFPPTLPHSDRLWDMQQQGQSLLTTHGFCQYEVSAYAQLNKACQHNLNYWYFGDYLGIGAGAHSKITTDTTIKRAWNVKNPKDYLKQNRSWQARTTQLSSKDRILEFFLNRLRLMQPVSENEFQAHTQLSFNDIQPQLRTLLSAELITLTPDISLTPRGHNFLNDVLEVWL